MSGWRRPDKKQSWIKHYQVTSSTYKSIETRRNKIWWLRVEGEDSTGVWWGTRSLKIKFPALTQVHFQSKEPRPQGGALKPKFLNPKPRSRNKFGMTKKPEPNRHVMLNLFQHLVCFFLLSAEAPFIPVHRTGFSGAILIKLKVATLYGQVGRMDCPAGRKGRL